MFTLVFVISLSLIIKDKLSVEESFLWNDIQILYKGLCNNLLQPKIWFGSDVYNMTLIIQWVDNIKWFYFSCLGAKS